MASIRKTKKNVQKELAEQVLFCLYVFNAIALKTEDDLLSANETIAALRDVQKDYIARLSHVPKNRQAVRVFFRQYFDTLTDKLTAINSRFLEGVKDE